MAIAFDGYTLIPELQHWFNHFMLQESIVNKYRNPIPADIPEDYLTSNSFINMLFNDDYSANSYEYRFLEETNFYCIPKIAVRRLQIYPGSWKYLKHDPSGENIFDLQTVDFTMLNALLAYRIDETSVTMIDSTNVHFVNDTTAGNIVLYATFNSLTTKLSKLIYLYLDLQIRGRFANYNNNVIITDCNLLESLYEAYLVDAYYKFMSGRLPDLIYDCVTPT